MRRWLAVPLAVAAITACSSDGDVGPASADDTTTGSETSTASDAATATTASGGSDTITRVDLDLGELIEVRPERVLLAAAIIASGDIDDAVAEGLVTPDEVDAAVAAIENDDLARWQALVDG